MPVFLLLEAAQKIEIAGRQLSAWANGHVVKVGENLWIRISNLAPLFLSGGPMHFLSFYSGFICVGRWCPWTNLSSNGAACGREQKIKNEHFQSKIEILFYVIKKGRTALEPKMCARTKIHKRTKPEIFTFFGNESKQKHFF